MKPCQINPKTRKPYSKHKYSVLNTRVLAYDPRGEAAQFAYDVVCKRCGHKAGTQQYGMFGKGRNHGI